MRNLLGVLALAGTAAGLPVRPAFVADEPCTGAALRRVFALAPAAVFVHLPASRDTPLCAATLVKVTPEKMRARLLDPATYRRAIPAFVRADVVARQPAQSGGDDLGVDWELEIPLSNPTGRLWLKPFPDAVQIRMASGAFAPGQLLWRTFPFAPGRIILALHGSVRPGNASWATRKLAGRHPLAEPAMTVAAALVLLRAVALDAAPDEGRGVRAPTVAPEPPPLAHLQGETARRVFTALAQEGAFALLHVAPGGRLGYAQVAAQVALGKEVLDDRLAAPEAWAALPGWSRVRASRAAVAAGGAGAPYRQTWVVDSRFPFVDFAATWDVTRGRSLRAIGTAQPAPGALWSWDTFALPAGVSSSAAGSRALAVFSLYPRLERVGTVPRKFIEAEPLLEHGMSLALAFVDAMTLLQAVSSH